MIIYTSLVIFQKTQQTFFCGKQDVCVTFDGTNRVREEKLWLILNL